MLSKKWIDKGRLQEISSDSAWIIAYKSYPHRVYCFIAFMCKFHGPAMCHWLMPYLVCLIAEDFYTWKDMPWLVTLVWRFSPYSSKRQREEEERLRVVVWPVDWLLLYFFSLFISVSKSSVCVIWAIHLSLVRSLEMWGLKKHFYWLPK